MSDVFCSLGNWGGGGRDATEPNIQPDIPETSTDLLKNSHELFSPPNPFEVVVQVVAATTHPVGVEWMELL